MENKKRPLILVSNDDGYRARGVHYLTKLLSGFADVVAVCPEGPQSGKSMALTVNEPLRITPLDSYKDEEPGVEWYTVNGTPVDCVKVSMHSILKDRRPDMVCTGINHGSNAAINVLYSGTMGAAFEGAAFDLPSIGFSLCDHSPEADFAPMIPYIEKIVRTVMDKGLPAGVALNVNAPKSENIKGMKQTVECKGHWSDEYKEYIDPYGRPFYWLSGTFVNEEPENPDTDQALLDAGYISIVPCGINRTYSGISENYFGD